MLLHYILPYTPGSVHADRLFILIPTLSRCDIYSHYLFRKTRGTVLLSQVPRDIIRKKSSAKWRQLLALALEIAATHVNPDCNQVFFLFFFFFLFLVLGLITGLDHSTVSIASGLFMYGVIYPAGLHARTANTYTRPPIGIKFQAD
jgi:hypothetical protein